MQSQKSPASYSIQQHQAAHKCIWRRRRSWLQRIRSNSGKFRQAPHWQTPTGNTQIKKVAHWRRFQYFNLSHWTRWQRIPQVSRLRRNYKSRSERRSRADVAKTAIPWDFIRRRYLPGQFYVREILLPKYPCSCFQFGRRRFPICKLKLGSTHIKFHWILFNIWKFLCLNSEHWINLHTWCKIEVVVVVVSFISYSSGFLHITRPIHQFPFSKLFSISSVP